MWRTFNCGIGYVFVTAAEAADALHAELESLQLQPRRLGSVVASPDAPRVVIA